MKKIGWPHLALGTVLWSAFSGCQLVLGDYRVDASGLAPTGRRLCQVNEYRCYGATLQVCNADRSDWLDFKECGSVNLCNLNAATCRACEPGQEYQCNEGYLLACASDGTWGVAPTAPDDGYCGSTALCSASEKRCLPEVCSAGTHRCTGATLERCSFGRDAWQVVTTCEAPELCDVALANLQVAEGKPATCVVTCDRASASCGVANCDTPGTLRCSPDAVQLQRCSEKFAWTEVETCGFFQLCNLSEAKCDAAACAAGERRCTGATLETCRTDTTGWREVTECANGLLCDPSAAPGQECVTGPCAEGAGRCNSVFIERCQGGAWERTRQCTSRCDPNTLACDAT